MKKSEKTATAMAFYNPQGLVPAFKQARAFAGVNGRVATLPDIIEARLAAKPADFIWNTYFTTMSAEYVGFSRAGNPLVIVAHGVGPMSNLDEILAVYGYEFKDKHRQRRGGRISQAQFLQLESGHYGPVQVIDLAAVWNRRQYAFSGHPISAKEIREEPLWQARLGPRWEEFVAYHTELANHYHEERGHPAYFNPCLVSMESASNCSYSTLEMFNHWMQASQGRALAHLLSVGGLMNSHHEYYESYYEKRESRTSLAFDVSCHEWWNGTRLLGLRPSKVLVMHPGLPDYDELLQTSLSLLWTPNPEGLPAMSHGFWHLLPLAGKTFTDYPKQGESLDNHEPEFLVTELEKLSAEPTPFQTTIGGYHGFFKYGIEEVRRLAPPTANAYTIDNVDIQWENGNPVFHTGQVTFYHVQVDTTKRLIRRDDLYQDFDLMMAIFDQGQ